MKQIKIESKEDKLFYSGRNNDMKDYMKNNIKKIIIFLIFAVVAGAGISIAAERVVNKVIARVNEDVILLSDYNERIEPILKEYEKVLTGPDKEKQIKKIKEEVLDQMIDERLLLQKAADEGVKITDAEVDQGIEEIRSRFKSEVEFQNEISRQGLTGEELRKNVKDQLKVIKLINQKVQARITPPTDEEVKKYYDSHENEMVTPEQVRARHILIKTTEKRTQEQAKKKAYEVYEKVKKEPSKFSTFAEKYSEGPSAKIGGDLGYFAKGEMVAEFEEVAFTMKVGEISKPVKTRFGYHIIKLVARKSSEKKTFSEVKDRLKNLLYQKKMESEYENFLRKLRDEAKISKTLNDL
jgi:parvulin-like peptidyl-prolyl isomerase